MDDDGGVLYLVVSGAPAPEGIPALVAACQAAEELVHETHLARDVPEIRDLAAVELREVDAGAEQTLAGVFRVVDDIAAQLSANYGQTVTRDNILNGLARPTFGWTGRWNRSRRRSGTRSPGGWP